MRIFNIQRVAELGYVLPVMAGYTVKFQALQEHSLFPVSLFNSSLFRFQTPVARPFTEPKRQRAAAARQNVFCLTALVFALQPIHPSVGLSTFISFPLFVVIKMTSDKKVNYGPTTSCFALVGSPLLLSRLICYTFSVQSVTSGEI